MVSLDIENAATEDARWCFEQYFAELAARFDAGFDPTLSISADVSEITPPHGCLIIARLRGEPVGCGAVKLHGSQPAELKRMWISPEVRGMGVGRRLLAELEHYASLRGARVMHLETNRTLKEAIALYRRSGYVEVKPFNSEPYAHHWFEKRLIKPTSPDQRK
jgi:ribosomal protein S18 acetylase RimI-like enzyme